MSPKPTVIALRLQRRRAILCVATKLTASYKRAHAKKERLQHARPQVRKRAFMALYTGLNAVVGLALAGMRQRNYTGKLCELGDWKWAQEVLGYRFDG